MLNRKQLDDFIQERGPYFYHATPLAKLPFIAKEGVKPWDETGYSQYKGGYLLPRPGHVYIGSLAFLLASYGGMNDKDLVMIRVDLRLLDPSSLNADEDHIIGGFKDPLFQTLNQDLVQPPVGEALLAPGGPCGDCGHDCLNCSHVPTIEETRGEWAEKNSALLDTPSVSNYSLRRGSIAVRGDIPPAALSINPKQLMVGRTHFLEGEDEKTYFSNIELGLVDDEIIPEILMGNDYYKFLFKRLPKFFLDWEVPVDEATLERARQIRKSASSFKHFSLAFVARGLAIVDSFPNGLRPPKPTLTNSKINMAPISVVVSQEGIEGY